MNVAPATVNVSNAVPAVLGLSDHFISNFTLPVPDPPITKSVPWNDAVIAGDPPR